jgi:hypothetical protein
MYGMSRGAFTAKDIHAAHVVLNAIGELAKKVDWIEYLSLVEFVANPPVTQLNLFIEMAERTAIVGEIFNDTGEGALREQLALERQIEKSDT